MPMQTKIGKTTLRLVTGDIADQDTDAVVTAAHWRLNKGTGTDGTIHTKGGPRIYEECRRIGGCPIGDAVITTGGDLRARHVIHAVGPVWRGGDEHEPELLASAYLRSLEVAVQQGLRSIFLGHRVYLKAKAGRPWCVPRGHFAVSQVVAMLRGCLPEPSAGDRQSGGVEPVLLIGN